MLHLELGEPVHALLELVLQEPGQLIAARLLIPEAGLTELFLSVVDRAGHVVLQSAYLPVELLDDLLTVMRSGRQLILDLLVDFEISLQFHDLLLEDPVPFHQLLSLFALIL